MRCQPPYEKFAQKIHHGHYERMYMYNCIGKIEKKIATKKLLNDEASTYKRSIISSKRK